MSLALIFYISNGLATKLASLPKLTRLNLDDTTIGDPALETVGKLPDLVFLHIGKCDITDKGVEQLYGLSKLKHLVMTNCPGVTPEAVTKLQAALPNLEQVDF